jgi:hypothetical protein
MSSNKNLIAALRLASSGMPIFPAQPVPKDNGNWSKPPCIKDWASKQPPTRTKSGSGGTAGPMHFQPYHVLTPW